MVSLRNVGYRLPTQVQNIPVIDVNTVMAGLEHQASLSWSNLSSNPRTAPTRNAKLCTWHNWFRPFHASNPYFLLPVSGKRMKQFLRFRLSCHSPPIETGRHHRPPIPRSSRLCPHCPLSSVDSEDEYHLVFECPIFQPLRQVSHFFQFPNLFNAIVLCPEGSYGCLQVCFRLFRHDKHLVLMF